LPLIVEAAHELAARQAVHDKLPYIPGFYLSLCQWDRFCTFFEDPGRKRGIMTLADLGPPNFVAGQKLEGHAVVLIRASPESLTFLNSWGPECGDEGCFKIRNPADFGMWKPADFGMWFRTVAVDESRLTSDDRLFMEEEHAKLVNSPRARALLHGERIACPQCSQAAPAEQHQGSCWRAVCPNCRQVFRARIESLIRSLYHRSNVPKLPFIDMADSRVPVHSFPKWILSVLVLKAGSARLDRKLPSLNCVRSPNDLLVRD
jgi:hypothetical protein